MAHGEFAEERRLFAQRRAGEQRHGDRAMQIAFAGHDIAHVRQNAVCRARHRAHAQLHGRPAFRRDDRNIVFLKDFLEQQHERVDLLC